SEMIVDEVFFICYFIFTQFSHPETALIQNGEAKSVIVLHDDSSVFCRMAAEELQYHIRRASETEIPIVDPEEARKLPDDITRIVIGPGELTRELGVDTDILKPEQYLIKAVGNYIVFAGHDAESNRRVGRTSAGTLYAVSHVLDRYLGIRWLWPGEVGTYVPKRGNISLPEMDVLARPELIERVIRTHLRSPDTEIMNEVAQWHHHHMLSTRSPYRFGHCFRHWWEKHHNSHPEYFAVPPNGAEQPYPQADRVKLCVSNPGVADQVMAEWKEAGMPDNWCVGPNDGGGFCTCENCRELDGFDQKPEDIWHSNACITSRYVKFWNKLLKRMKELNPSATLSSYGYSSYREPLPDMKLEDGMIIQIVPAYWQYDLWKGWEQSGAKIMLRPNWWHMGAIAPHLPLHKAESYFRFARNNSMIGIDFDSLMGYWGTQSPYYYMIARLATRPDLTADDVIEEYCSAFGQAAQVVKGYIDYWETYTEEAAYTAPAGGSVSQNPDGLYEQACRKYKLPVHPLSGGWRVLPYLYTDEVLGKAHDILDEADRAADNDGPMVSARIKFLRDGLKHLELTRDVIQIAYASAFPDGMTEQDYLRKMEELDEFRKEITPRHVVWGDSVKATMKRRGIRPEAGGDKKLILEGL
ncbi:DUF4838 domain-containing protein, partial [Candidatus Poribacteria bacterium]